MPREIVLPSAGLLDRTYKVPFIVEGCRGATWDKCFERTHPKERPLRLNENEQGFVCDGSFLKKGDCFRIAHKVPSLTEAVRIYNARINCGTCYHILFHYDQNRKIMWFLAQNHPLGLPQGFDHFNSYFPD